VSYETPDLRKSEAGPPLMIAAPGIAIDLPLKVLVWEDPDGITKISYNTPAYLQARYALPRGIGPEHCDCGNPGQKSSRMRTGTEYLYLSSSKLLIRSR
jgi:hypothetical protein